MEPLCLGVGEELSREIRYGAFSRFEDGGGGVGVFAVAVGGEEAGDPELFLLLRGGGFREGFRGAVWDLDAWEGGYEEAGAYERFLVGGERGCGGAGVGAMAFVVLECGG